MEKIYGSAPNIIFSFDDDRERDSLTLALFRLILDRERIEYSVSGENGTTKIKFSDKYAAKLEGVALNAYRGMNDIYVAL